VFRVAKNIHSKPRTVSYLRVSTAVQDTRKNKQGVRAYANSKDFGRVEFFEETVSGKVPWKKRKIKKLLDELQAGDRLIVPELSRLGRSTLEIMEILALAKEKRIAVYDIKNNWELNDSIQSEVMAFAFSIAARIERDLMAARITEGIAAARAKGKRLGRPPGPGKSKLDPYKDEIQALLKTGSRQNYIAKKYGVTPGTVLNYIKRHDLDTEPKY